MNIVVRIGQASKIKIVKIKSGKIFGVIIFILVTYFVINNFVKIQLFQLLLAIPIFTLLLCKLHAETNAYFLIVFHLRNLGITPA